MSQENNHPDSAQSGQHAGAPESNVPADFPWDPEPAGLSGSQPKVAATLIDGRYVVGWTPEERADAYDICLELVEELEGYVQRKLQAMPHHTSQSPLDQVDKAMRQKGWEISPLEFDWIIAELRRRFFAAQEGA